MHLHINNIYESRQLLVHFSRGELSHLVSTQVVFLKVWRRGVIQRAGYRKNRFPRIEVEKVCCTWDWHVAKQWCNLPSR